ncbi:unnamed protein product [Blepharisma stoltei]|uniref:Uncharacterized protein n=1 Tax=Blepharisma stoltei TaxID=1481888 RepID=A0AAU9J3B3_9CILI|nr:unnamed protein product [Blepharisma stoltei]
MASMNSFSGVFSWRNSRTSIFLLWAARCKIGKSLHVSFRSIFKVDFFLTYHNRFSELNFTAIYGTDGGPLNLLIKISRELSGEHIRHLCVIKAPFPINNFASSIWFDFKEYSSSENFSEFEILTFPPSLI